jgi:hypothetical protein
MESSEVVAIVKMVMTGAFVVLLIVYGPKIANWLKSLLAKSNKPEAADVASDISKKVDRMIDERDDIAEVIYSTKAQTELLIRLAVELAKHQTDNLRDMQAFQAAIEAIQSGDALRLAIAAGTMPDPELKVALNTNPDHVEASYWVSALSLIAKQQGELQLWAGRYERMSQSLFDEVAQIKSKLLLLEARQDILQVGATYREVVSGIDQVLGVTDKTTNGTKVRFLPAINRVQ